jgi:hypothetical protein
MIAPGHASALTRQIVLHPDLAQSLYSGQGAERRRCLSTIHRVQQCIAVGPNHVSQDLPLGGTLGQAGMRNAWPMTRKPLGLGAPAEPLRRRDSQRVECGSHRLTDQLQAVDGTNGPEHMRGVRALTTAGVDHPLCLQALQHEV